MKNKSSSLVNGFALIDGRDAVSPIFKEVSGGFQEMDHKQAQMVMLTGGLYDPEVLIGENAADAVAADMALRAQRVDTLRKAWAGLAPGDLDALVKSHSMDMFIFQEMVSKMNYLSAMSIGLSWEPKQFLLEGSEPAPIDQDWSGVEAEDYDDALFGVPTIQGVVDEERRDLGIKIKNFGDHLRAPSLIARHEILKAAFNDRAPISVLEKGLKELIKDHISEVLDCAPKLSK